METWYKASLPSKFNWQKIVYSLDNNSKSDMFINVAVCLPITHLLILLLRNHGFWIAQQPITLHLIHNFSHTSSSFIPNVNMPTGSTVPISSTGTIKFNDNISLKDVLCVPSFNLNIMSVGKITSSLNCCVVFTPHGYVLQDLATGRMISSGKQHAGLYYMSPLPNQVHTSQISSDSDLWHKRLGHLLRRVYNLHLPYYLSTCIFITTYQ